MPPYVQRPIPLKDKLNMFLRDYPATGAIRGLPVVCLHGLTRNSLDFEGIALRITAMGRRVLAPDIRGRGWSDRDPQPARYRPDVYALDIMSMLDGLEVPRAIFIGTSMGGMITMLIAQQAPARVAASVLNDVGPFLATPGIQRIVAAVGKSGPVKSWDEMVELVKTTRGHVHPDGDEEFWRVFARRVAQKLPDGSIAFAYDPAISQMISRPQPVPPPSLVPAFTALAKMPMLLIRGELSDLLTEEGVEEMRKIKPDLEFASVPRTGHAPTLEEPEAWAAIESFLSRVP
jgi:pimeloyl-ACP methyl ester carboxylesterase